MKPEKCWRIGRCGRVRSRLAPPGDWRIWLILAGRGFGKTLAINQWALAQARAMPKSRGALVAATEADARAVLVEGESGILNVAPPDFMTEVRAEQAPPDLPQREHSGAF